MSNTIDVCQTGYDYEQFQLNELENENMKLKKQLEIATRALKKIDPPNINFEDYNNVAIELWEIAHNALKEMKGVK